MAQRLKPLRHRPTLVKLNIGMKGSHSGTAGSGTSTTALWMPVHSLEPNPHSRHTTGV